MPSEPLEQTNEQLAVALETLAETMGNVGAELPRGRVVEDLRREGLGFDAIASDVEGRGADFLVVRALDGDGNVWLKSTEWTQLQHLNSHAALYVVKGAHLLRLAPKDSATAEVDEATRRVSIHIDGLQLAMPEQTRNDV